MPSNCSLRISAFAFSLRMIDSCHSFNNKSTFKYVSISASMSMPSLLDKTSIVSCDTSVRPRSILLTCVLEQISIPNSDCFNPWSSRWNFMILPWMIMTSFLEIPNKIRTITPILLCCFGSFLLVLLKKCSIFIFLLNLLDIRS